MTVWSPHGSIAGIVCLAWCISEILLGRIRLSKTDSSRSRDRSSLRLLWLAIIIGLVPGCYLGAARIGYIPSASAVVSVIGLLIIVMGLIIRWIAIMTLRSQFTTNVSIQEGHELVMSGLYGVVRHPSYTGSLLSFLGLGLTFASWISAVVIFVPVTSAFLYRISVEEAALSDHFGRKYEAYARKTRRLIPLIY